MTAHDVFIELANQLPESMPIRGFMVHLNHCVQRITDAHWWTWRRLDYSTTLVADYSTGTVAVTNGSATVTGTGTTGWSTAMIGRKIRIGNGAEYTISTYTFPGSVHTITLDTVYGGVADAASSYVIYENTITLPVDVGRILRVWNVTEPNRLRPMALRELQEHNKIFAYGGSPDWYSVSTRTAVGQFTSSSVLMLYPYPVAGDTINVSYLKRYSRVANIDATVPLPGEMLAMLCQYILSRIIRQQGDTDWNRYRIEYESYTQMLEEHKRQDAAMADFSVQMARADIGPEQTIATYTVVETL